MLVSIPFLVDDLMDSQKVLFVKIEHKIITNKICLRTSGWNPVTKVKWLRGGN
jgi:hypothetical protein